MTSALDINKCEQARLSRDIRFDGKFFTAVLTTGIFCRPICPARPPKAENVRYYLSAQQAQLAGYKPCKRCFPEQAAEKSVPLKLKKIIQNFDYQHDSVKSIATRYQLSARQVQRLFQQYYGISPSEFFQQQRLLLARKLLLTTQLPISDICFASGFNSVRRFNKAIKTRYLTSPKELRKNKTINKPCDQVEIILAYRPPFDWSLMLSFFRYRQIPSIEKITDDEYQRNIRFGENDKCEGWIKVKHHATKSALILTTSLSDYRHLNWVITRVRRMFDLDADMMLIHKRLSNHAVLSDVISKYPGLRLPGCWDVFEFSIRAILGQQISVKAATTYAGRIAEKYGEIPNIKLPELALNFPDIEQLKNASFEGLGLTNARIATLKTWLNFYQTEHQLLSDYQSIEQLQTTLCQLKGIGPWTVNYIAMRGLSDPDAFPSADLGIIKALTIDDNKPNNKAILALAEHWRPWRAYAAIYLWHSLQH